MHTIERGLKEYELKLLDPAFCRTPDAADLLADSFVEFGSAGQTFNKQEILASLQNAAPIAVQPSDVRVQMLDQSVALVTYRAGKASQSDLRKSIWHARRGRWQMVFHANN